MTPEGNLGEAGDPRVPETSPTAEAETQAKRLLSNIREHGLDAVALQYGKTIKAILRLDEAGPRTEDLAKTEVQELILRPANPLDVRDYLYSLSSLPPIKIRDIGSVDEGLVTQLGLKESRFADQLEEIIVSLDPQATSISVADLVKVKQEMEKNEQKGIKKLLVLRVLEIHGVVFRVIKDDPNSWKMLEKTVNELSKEEFSAYAQYLRQRKLTSKPTTLRDVVDHIFDVHDIQTARVGRLVGSTLLDRGILARSARSTTEADISEDFFAGLEEIVKDEGLPTDTEIHDALGND